MNQAEQASVIPSSTITRRLAAIVFADIAGFSRLMALKDVETVLRWRKLRIEIMEPHMLRHGGRVSEIAGDAVLAEFPSVVNAVQWAADVQRAQERAASRDDPLALHLRIAINVDDIIDEDGRLQGDGINIASRIHQAAEPGQIVVTGAVRDYLINRLPLTFHDLGSPPMKNIVRPVRVNTVEWSEGARGDPISQPYIQWSSRPTLAVLPFRTIGGVEGDSYYGEGITDAIITDLSKNRSLYIIARNSTLRYRNSDKSLRQIAGELDVRYLIDGSVQRQGTRLRITAELTDISGNVSIWAKRYEGSTDDLFEFQDRIAESVLASIEPRVRAAETARVHGGSAEFLDAYHCVLRAISRLYSFTTESYREAGELLERAVELDPTYAQAHAYLAWWLNFRIGEGVSENPEADMARAIAISQRAVELDRDDPFALAVAGHILSFVGKNPEDALELFDQALALNQNSAFGWGLSALTLAYLGRADEALERLKNVWRLNPFDPLNFYFWIVAGIAEFVAGRYSESIVWLHKSKRANPRFVACLRTLAASLALSGDEAGAQSVARELLLIEPSFRISNFVSWYPLRREDDLTRLAKGLRAAGLPD